MRNIWKVIGKNLVADGYLIEGRQPLEPGLNVEWVAWKKLDEAFTLIELERSVYLEKCLKACNIDSKVEADNL